MRRWFGVILGLVSLFGAVAKLRADAQMVAQGYVVPGVYYADLGNTSAVGLTNVCRFNIAVYWVLADADDTVRARGGFVLEKEHVVPFVLAALSRQVSADPAAQAATLPPYERGVLIFAADTDGDGALRASDRACLLAEAFHADVVAGDAVYIPVWPFSAEDIQPIPRISPPFPPAGIDDLSNMGAAPLTTLSSGIVDEVGQPGAVGYARFALGGEDRTQLVVWSASAAPMTVLMTFHRQDGAKVSVSVPLSKPHLNVVELGKVPGVPDDFSNGYVSWMLPCDTAGDYVDLQADGNGVAIYSVIHAPALGAAQTILGRGEKAICAYNLNR